MSGDIHHGDRVTINGGRGHQGIVNYQNGTPADACAAFQEMLRQVEILRGQVPDRDRQLIDESLSALTPGEIGEAPAPGAVRRALGMIAGIAAVVGETGAPVIEAVRRVTDALSG